MRAASPSRIPRASRKPWRGAREPPDGQGRHRHPRHPPHPPRHRPLGGRIINIASTAGAMGNAGQANYSAAKAGLIGLTKSTARELAHWGILVNAVAPGLIETDMAAALPDDAREALLAQVPLKRIGTAREVAEMVGFLAGDGAAYVTGQVFHVNGGLYM